MKAILRGLAWSVTTFASMTAARVDAANSSFTLGTSGTPPGFDELARPRELLVDVYYGGRKVGDALAVVRPGFLQFKEPAAVAALVPNVIDPADLSSAMSGELPTNAASVCMASNSGSCGTIHPEGAGIIFDEEHFRADLFVAPAMLRAVRSEDEKFLDVPSGPLSLTSVSGLSISGTGSRSPLYNFQNRTVVALGAARVRADVSYASRLGFVPDDLVGEVDRGDRRYSAGLFWAPGLDLTGRRRIAGVGFGTQFDTRADRETLMGTPITLFLSQPAQVDFLVDGRLVGSRVYDAGNEILDTSALPAGSYPLVLRIHEANGNVREERRFFVKNSAIAPVGRPIVFGYAGMLANTRRYHPISVSNSLFYQLGMARRLSENLAVDLSAIGTQKKTMGELGAWLLTGIGQVRAAGLVSTQGDRAALLQIGSTGRVPFNLSLDARRVWSRDGEPLLPLPGYSESFEDGQPTQAQLGRGSYAQVSGSVGYRVGTAYFSVTGSMRKDAGVPREYSLGPSFTWPVVSRGNMQLTFQANAQRSRTTTTAFAGFRLLFTGNGLSALTTGGRGSIDSRDGSGRSVSRAVAGFSANYFREDDDLTRLSLEAGIDRGLESTIARANGTLYSRFGNGRADILETLKGRGGLQYGLTFQSALAMDGGDIGVGGLELDDSALIVELGGPPDDSSFQVLIDESPWGCLKSGERLSIHLQPYREYRVRLRPVEAAPVFFDSADRTVTLYPGTVRSLRWTAQPFFTVFGQAVSPDGTPVADAMIQAPHSVGETDSAGYFQVDVAAGDQLVFSAGPMHCSARVTGRTPRTAFASLGKVICK